MAETVNYIPNIHLLPSFLLANIPVLLGVAMGHSPGFLASRKQSMSNNKKLPGGGCAEMLFKGSDSAGRYNVLFTSLSCFFLPAT